MALGLIVVGDYALATGADRHVGFAASLLAKSAQALSWAWFVPADRVQIAAALHEAWQRPHPVVCFGGLGDGIDDHVLPSMQALRQGRIDVGLPVRVEDEQAGWLQVANIAFFHGQPSRSHPVMTQWWQSLAVRSGDESALAHELVRWKLPESAENTHARHIAKTRFPEVAQRVIAAEDGGVVLCLSGSSKGKAQAARKALQAALKADRGQ